MLVVASGGQGRDRAVGREVSACAEFDMCQRRMHPYSWLLDASVCTVLAGVSGKRQLEAEGGSLLVAAHVDRAFQLACRGFRFRE